MNKKIAALLVLLSFTAVWLVGCGGESSTVDPDTDNTDIVDENPNDDDTDNDSDGTAQTVTNLSAPANVTYADRVVSFDEVENAQSYTITFYQNGETVASETIETTSFNVNELGIVGDYTIEVKAQADSIVSETTSITATILYCDYDILIEAEDALLNETNINTDETAHGGAYAWNINDCGQGFYLRYFAYEAGERTIEMAYATGQEDSYMNIYINGAAAPYDYVDFPEVNGWYNDGGIDFSVTSLQVEVEQGWNELYLIKDGTSSDNYGGYVQMDYFIIRGTDKEYALDSVDKTATSYRLECEAAEWHWADENQRPTHDGSPFSMGYYCGEMNTAGDGVKFTFKVSDSGNYLVQLAYGKGADLPIKFYINGTLMATQLTNASTGWNSIALDENNMTAYFEAGQTITIDFEQDGEWFVPDYVLVTLITE